MYFVYILSNWDDSVLYIGVTSNLPKRLYEHRNGLSDGFTKKYNVHKLVYYEHTNEVYSAISREKQLKKMGAQQKERTHIQNESTMDGSVSRMGLTCLLPATSGCEDPSTSLRSAQDDSIILNRKHNFLGEIDTLWKHVTKSIGAVT